MLLSTDSVLKHRFLSAASMIFLPDLLLNSACELETFWVVAKSQNAGAEGTWGDTVGEE